MKGRVIRPFRGSDRTIASGKVCLFPGRSQFLPIFPEALKMQFSTGDNSASHSFDRVLGGLSAIRQ